MRWASDKKHWIAPNYFIRSWKGDSLVYSKTVKDSILQLYFTPTDLTQSTVTPEEMNYWELKQFVKRHLLQACLAPPLVELGVVTGLLIRSTVFFIQILLIQEIIISTS